MAATVAFTAHRAIAVESAAFAPVEAAVVVEADVVGTGNEA
jgi:hypothetical protein